MGASSTEMAGRSRNGIPAPKGWAIFWGRKGGGPARTPCIHPDSPKPSDELTGA